MGGGPTILKVWGGGGGGHVPIPPVDVIEVHGRTRAPMIRFEDEVGVITVRWLTMSMQSERALPLKCFNTAYINETNFTNKCKSMGLIEETKDFYCLKGAWDQAGSFPYKITEWNSFLPVSDPLILVFLGTFGTKMALISLFHEPFCLNVGAMDNSNLSLQYKNLFTGYRCTNKSCIIIFI